MREQAKGRRFMTAGAHLVDDDEQVLIVRLAACLGAHRHLQRQKLQSMTMKRRQGNTRGPWRVNTLARRSAGNWRVQQLERRQRVELQHCERGTERESIPRGPSSTIHTTTDETPSAGTRQSGTGRPARRRQTRGAHWVPQPKIEQAERRVSPTASTRQHHTARMVRN